MNANVRSDSELSLKGGDVPRVHLIPSPRSNPLVPDLAALSPVVARSTGIRAAHLRAHYRIASRLTHRTPTWVYRGE